MNPINYEEFREIFPAARVQACFLTITAKNKTSLSPKIAQATGRRVRLHMSSGGLSVLLVPGKENETCHTVTKAGFISSKAFVEAIAAEGVSLPARYEMQKDEATGAWIGKLVRPAKPDTKKATPRKPRVSGLGSMVTE